MLSPICVLILGPMPYSFVLYIMLTMLLWPVSGFYFEFIKPESHTFSMRLKELKPWTCHFCGVKLGATVFTRFKARNDCWNIS